MPPWNILNMKFTKLIGTICVVSLVFVFAQNAGAQTLGLDSFDLFDEQIPQGNGVLGNNVDLFDGSIFMDSPFGVFGTPLYLRERTNENQPQLEVRADLNFDLSGFSTPVMMATLEFTAYTLNDLTDFTVGRIVPGGTDFEREFEDGISVPETFSGAQDVENYSIDVTTIVNTWISDPATNLGFRIQLDTNINDGMGIFEGTATEINNGSGGFLPIPADYIPMQLVLGGGLLLGDVNCDGVIDLLDVAPFVDLIISGGFDPKADINGDGMVDLLDIAPFVDLLLG